MTKTPKAPKARTPKEVVADLEKATPLVNECMKKIHGHLMQEKSDLWDKCNLFTDIMSLLLLSHFRSVEHDKVMKKEDIPQAINEYCQIIAVKTKGLFKDYDKAMSTGSVKIH